MLSLLSNIVIFLFSFSIDNGLSIIIRNDIALFMLCCRSSINQIQAPDAMHLQLHFKNPLSKTLYTNTSISPADIVVRKRNSEETVVTGPSSSIRVEMVVLYGDFKKEDWTEKEFNDNVASARTGKGSLLMGTVDIRLSGGVGTFNDIKLTDNSTKRRSGRFRLGVKVVEGNGIQERIMEARSEAFYVRDKRGECKLACFF